MDQQYLRSDGIPVRYRGFRSSAGAVSYAVVISDEHKNGCIDIIQNAEYPYVTQVCDTPSPIVSGKTKVAYSDTRGRVRWNPRIIEYLNLYDGHICADTASAFFPGKKVDVQIAEKNNKIAGKRNFKKRAYKHAATRWNK